MVSCPVPSARRTTATAVAAATVTGLLTLGTCVPAAFAAPAHPHVQHYSSTVSLAPGVTMRRFGTQIAGAPEQVSLLGIDLSRKGVGIDSASPGNVVGAPRATVRAQTNARGALAGVNADFFNLDRGNAAPRGVLITSGRMLKSPTAARNANLVIRRGRSGLETASVGALAWSAKITRIRKGARTVARSATALNSLVAARAGGLSLLSSAMAPSYLGRACALATGRIVKGVWTVSSVRSGAYSVPALSAASWGVVSCSGSAQQWITSTLRTGDRVTVTQAVAGGTPWAAVSGGSVLVRNGRSYSDPDGEVLPYGGRNAETFACVARNGTQVTIGTIDGYSGQSWGVTYHQLTQYMLSLGSCWSGVVFDGGGSTTMVARLPGATRATVQNVPADDPPRPVADTLVVFGRS